MPEMDASHARANLPTLPAELRNRIYELVLAADDGIELEDGSFMIEIGDFLTGDEEEGLTLYLSTPFWCTQPPLTRVSRQMRAETLPVYYGCNTFVTYVAEVICIGERDMVAIQSLNHHVWLKDMTAANRGLLKHLHVRWCPNASQVALPRSKMAKILETLGVGLPEDAISTWVKSFDPTYIGRGIPSDWEDVSISKEGRTAMHEDEIESGFVRAPDGYYGV